MNKEKLKHYLEGCEEYPNDKDITIDKSYKFQKDCKEELETIYK